MLTDRLQQIFDENFSRRGELGASLSVWRDGEEIVNLAAGFCDREKTKPWTANTPVLVWSVGKGWAAACVLHCLEQHALTPQTRVAEIWPEFAQAGKQDVTLAQLMSHQAGLPLLPPDVSVFDHGAIVSWLAGQAPAWPLGSGHGYHPRTFGFLLDEIVRRLARMTLGEYWQHTFAEPLQLDAWIGVPESELDRVAPVFSPRAQKLPNTDFFRAYGDPTSLTAKAFFPAKGIAGVGGMNTREARAASFPAFGGIATASAIAKFYAMLAQGGELNGIRFFSPRAMEWMTTTLTSGFDKVLRVETAFSAGFMKDPIFPDGKKRRALFGPSPRAFGHPGSGGSLAFADPENRIAFAYVMNQMDIEVLPNEKPLLLVDAVYA